MTSKECINKLIEKYSWLGKEYCRLIENENPYNSNQQVFEEMANKVLKDLDKLEKLEKVIEILKRTCLFEFEEETIYQRDEWADCYVIYVTQFNNGFDKEEYELLKEVLGNEN